MSIIGPNQAKTTQRNKGYREPSTLSASYRITIKSLQSCPDPRFLSPLRLLTTTYVVMEKYAREPLSPERVYVASRADLGIVTYTMSPYDQSPILADTNPNDFRAFTVRRYWK